MLSSSTIMSSIHNLQAFHVRNFHGRNHNSLFLPFLPATHKCHLHTKQFLNGDLELHHHHHHHSSRPPKPTFIIQASSSNHAAGESQLKPELVIVATITVVLAVANRVLYKLALVPMKHHPFFLAQLATFGYVALYFTILRERYRAGIVTDEMLAIPKWRFLVIGVLEALGVASGMASAAMLPGPAIPILSQTFLVWQLGFSSILLGRRYSVNQIAGCVLVALGVVVAVASGSNTGQIVTRIDVLWPALLIASSAFQACASIFKESVFVDAATRLKGKSVDVFVVNSFGSGYQALFVLLLMPFLTKLKGIPLTQLPAYLKSGAGCFLNIGANSPACDGAPLLPLLYMATNVAFNISLLTLVKLSSAVVSSLTSVLSVPVAMYILSVPLPYLQQRTSLSPYFLSGSMILLFGLLLYNIPLQKK